MRLAIPPSHHNTRLDQALELLLPELGRRARVRCIQEGRVLLDGKPARKGQLVRKGQRLELLQPAESQYRDDDVAILAQTDSYAALYKPPGLHSAMLQGGSGASLEERLPELFPGLDPALLNRLDRPTSGIVLVGLRPDAAGEFRLLEDAGRVDKRYLLVVEGRCSTPCIVKNLLDTSRRRTTRILQDAGPQLRWTELRPLVERKRDSHWQTLLEARIKKGARHQIRAHCAHIGAPILGDTIYGRDEEHGFKSLEGLYLHHMLLRMPGFEASCLPQWLDQWPGAESLLQAENEDS